VKPSTLYWIALGEALGIGVLVPAFIWDLRMRWPHFWIFFPVWITLSFLLHGDTPRTLGWRADNLLRATKNAAGVFALLAAALLLTGALFGTLRVPLHLLSARRLWLYFAFCLLQQVILQSFLTNRLLSFCRRSWVAALLAGGIFAAAHWPNPVLVPVTFCGGAAAAWLFSRERNVIPLATGQALIGSLVWMCFPAEWHRGMRVGPGFYLYP
jgi:hypothetical protein